MTARLPKVLFDRQGPLTRELLRRPAGFGLGQRPARTKPTATTTSVCGYCSTGCGLELHLREGEAVSLSPATDYPVNLGMACPKGWEALTPLGASDRATMPVLRDENGKRASVDWSTALSTFCERFRDIQRKYGPESVAFLSTGQMTTEEMALLGAVTKFGMGITEGDGNTRQCMATSVVAYKQSFGFDAPPYTYRDFEESDVIVLVGSNLCIAHPILWERVCRNQRQPEIIVIDPRKTETAMSATQHLPLAPKTDLVFLYGVAKLLIDADAIDRRFIHAFTRGFEEFAEHVEDYDLDRVSAETGLKRSAIRRVAETIARGDRVSFWWTMGVNQSHEGVRVAQAIINLALMTGNIGRPGTGANSITGQCNAMGSRLFSNTTNLLGGRDFADADQRKEVADLLGFDARRIPSRASLAYDQILERVLSGKIRGLWIIATNTAHSWINQADLDDIFGKLDFLVVQDLYTTTETAERADLLLPAAGWSEKEGTFINSERRIGLVKKAARAPGQALADFHIFRLVAEAWGLGPMFREWDTPEAVFRILARLSKGRPCDFSGIEGYDDLERCRGIQWPHPEGAPEPEPERRLFGDGRFFHADSKARFVWEAPRPLPEPTDAKYPFTLSTGRGSASQWHTQTRTSKSPLLRKLYPNEPYVELNPEDARRFEIAPHDSLVVETRRGKMVARAYVTHVVGPGQLFVPMHYATTNQLTFPAFDPYSRQPAYKACAARIRLADERDM